MAVYAYVARDSGGQRVAGTLSGSSEQSVLAELHALRLAPVRVRQVRQRPRLQRGVTMRQLAGLYRQLSDLLRAGVPLLRALRLLGRGKTNPRLTKVMSAVADAVAEGGRLAEAMAAHPDVFPSVQIAMIRAGERGGFLESVLARMGEFLEVRADMRSRVIGNLIYPIVLIGLCLVVIVGALVLFVPKFEPFYTRIDAPLPTKIVLGASAFLTSYLPITLAVLVGLVAAWAWLRRRAAVRRRVALLQLRLPQIGPLIRNLAVARFTRLTGTLLANGVPLLTAMQIARDSAGHMLLEEAIEDATAAVRAGETLAEPLGRSGLFSEDVIEMIAVGESANNLPDVLVTIADTIDSRVDRMLGILVRLMEPLLLLVLGGVVMFIFIALVVPMMRMSASLSG